jgi:hypothetical protein
MRAWVISTWKQSPRWRFRVLRRSDFKSVTPYASSPHPRSCTGLLLRDSVMPTRQLAVWLGCYVIRCGPQCLAGWCVLFHLVAAWCTLHVVTKHSGAKSSPAASDTHMNMVQSVSITTGMAPIAGQTHSQTKYGSFDAGFVRLSRTHTG